MKIKICGMKQPENIREVADLKPDFMGFIFYPKSPRYVVGNLSADAIKDLPKSVIKTGVFVNESMETVLDCAKTYDLVALQLHGNETPQFCDALQQLGFIVIKAFSVGEDFTFDSLEAYQLCCNYFLFDTKTPKHGGSGKKFDWKILDQYNNAKPLFLSGGIGPGDEEAIKALKHLDIFALDLNSKFELEPGLKNVAQLETFMNNIKKDAPKWNL